MNKKSVPSLSLRKLILSALVAAPLATLPSPLWAVVDTTLGGNLSSSAGAATSITGAGTANINISTPDRTVLTWKEFGGGLSPINQGESINFALPGASSAVLNRVVGLAGNNPAQTVINGNLTSNGRIYVLNTNGVVLGANGTITATGVALSTVSESDFNFANNGVLSFVGPTNADVTVAGTISPVSGQSGVANTVSLAGRNVFVSGSIDAGTVAIISNGATLGGAANVVIGKPTTTTNNVTTVGYGNVTISTNGGAADLATGAGSVTINGGTLTVNTAGGAVSQGGAGQLAIGNTNDNANLTINTNGTAGNGSVTLPNVTGNGKTLNVTLNAGTTNITDASGDLNLNASTITSAGTALKLTATTGNINSGGNTTVTGTNATISLSATTADKNITYSGVGDLVFSSISSQTTGTRSQVKLTSTSGNITLPGFSTVHVVATAPGSITQTGAIVSKGNATFDSGNVTTLDNVGNDFTNVILKNAPNGATIVDSNDVTLANGTNATGNVTLSTPSGNITLGATGSDTIAVAGDLNLNASSRIALAIVSAGSGYTTAPTVTLTGGAGSGATATATLGVNAISTPTTAGAGYTTPPAVTLTGGGGSGATATSTLAVNAVTVTAAGTGYTAGDVLTLPGGATATVATVDGTGAITGLNVTTGGTYTSALPAAAAVTGGTGTGATVTATGTVSGIVVGAAGTNYTSMPTVALAAAPNGGVNATGSSATGKVVAVTVTNYGTNYTSAPTVALTGNATASATIGGGTVTQANNNLSVQGKLNINAYGNVAIDGAANNGVGLNNQFGQVNVAQTSPAGISVFETTTLNLGNISSSTAGVAPYGNLNAYSATSIINSGQLIVNNVTAGAGTAAAPGDITLDFAGAQAGQGNQINGTVSVYSDLGLLAPAGGQVGNYLGKNLTVANESTTKLLIPTNIYSAGLTGNISVTELTANGIQNADLTNNASAAIITSGNLVLNAKTGTINLSNTSNQFKATTVTSAGDVTVKGAGPFTVNATLTEAAPSLGHVATFTSGDALTIGSFTSNYTGANGVVFNSGNKKAISDSVGGISIYGNVNFNSNGAISITKAGHSFGGITATTANDGSATITESGTLRVVKFTNGGGKGTLSLTSTNGDILEDAASANGIVAGSGSNKVAATFTASQGSVTLTDNANNNALFGTVSIRAAGNSTITQKQSLTLGNVTVSNGTFTADVSAQAGNPLADTNASISQASGTSIYTYGATTFAANGTGNITLDNTGNRFGGLTLSTTNGGNITIRELTTMNLQSVSTTGPLVATDEGGDIIDSGSGAISAGSATFNAKNNITLGLANSDYSLVSFTAGGNVSILDQNNLTLGASTIGGTLRVTDTSANAALSQTGALVVTGDTTFSLTGSNSSINLQTYSLQNQFGALQFFVGSGGATIGESTTMNLKAGSVASGQVFLSTGGDFVTSGTGSSSFLYNGANGSSLQISATSGSIKPGAGSLTVVHGLTVYSNVLMDLSGLSLAGNLYGIAPQYSGTGTYVAPAP